MTDNLSQFLHPRVVTMLFFGFSAGLPILLIFSSLSVWLTEAGVERSLVTMFSWAALGYSFKFVWAPLVDSIRLPILTRVLGRRRAWLLLSQCMVLTSIALMGLVDPVSSQNSLYALAIFAVMLGFSSATQDIVIDAYRIESAAASLQALMASTYIVGYRIGMVTAGAGALYLATAFGSGEDGYQFSAWRYTYFIMALAMLVGICTTLRIAEPERRVSEQAPDSAATLPHGRVVSVLALCILGFVAAYFVTAAPGQYYKRLLAGLIANKAIASVVIETLRLLLAVSVAGVLARLSIAVHFLKGDVVQHLYISPVREFFARYQTTLVILLLCLIGGYRISDIVLGVIANIFYYELGFSKNQIASASKVFGLLMSIAGGLVGGVMCLRWGVMRLMLVGAVLASLTNLLFVWLAGAGNVTHILYLVIGADNLAGGLATAVFVAFLSALTNIRFTAMQYAIFTSVMTLFPKMLGGYSGSIVAAMGYESFFTFTALIGVPIVILIMLVDRQPHIRLNFELKGA